MKSRPFGGRDYFLPLYSGTVLVPGQESDKTRKELVTYEKLPGAT